MSKLKTNFILKTVKSDEKPIILILNFGYKEYDTIKNKTTYKPLKYYTGIKVNKILWDKEKKLPLDKNKLKEIISIEQIVKDVFTSLVLNNKDITPQLFKNEIDLKLNRVSKTNNIIRLVDYIREIILKTDTNRSANTLKQYIRLANKIEDFETRKNVTMNADSLDEQLYLMFLDDIRLQVNKINTVWSTAKTLKAVLNEISRKYDIKVFKPSNQLAKADKISSVNDDKIYLNYEQIQTIIDYQPKTEKLQNTKLIFLTLLFTGCRFSDVFKIEPKFNYSKKGTDFKYTHFISTKTSTEIIIPILKPLEDAYRANNNEPPYKISAPKFNEYVKDLVELAGLDEEITLSYTNSMGKKEFEVKKLYQFVSSHIGRRSFITNLINHVPITILTKITGHSLRDKNIIFGYNKISLLDNTVLFVKELKRLSETNPEDFPIQLI